MPKLCRLLIDCSFVDFSRQPTGIPRVVLRYIEVGYEWGRRNNIEVVPVVPTDSGLYICRPVPGRDAPAPLLAAAYTKSSVSSGPLGHEPPLSEVGSVVTDLRQVLSSLIAVTASLWTTLNPATASPQLPRIETDATSVDDAAIADGRLTTSTLVEPGPNDLLFCPAYWHDVPPDRYHELSARGAKIVILVHDILPIIFPRFYHAPWCYEFRRNVSAAFSYADAFCTVSDYTRNGLTELGLRERLPTVPMMTSYNGFDPLVSEAGLSKLEGPRLLPDSPAISAIRSFERYYLMVGTIEPKKGHRPVIQCFEAMWRAGLGSNLVIIGRRGWEEADAVRAIEGSPFYGEKLFWFSGIDDFELAQMYKSCRALVFASLGEGFGIPMIEAAAYGRPVLAYDTAIVREILGSAACLFTNGDDFIRLIAKMEQDGENEAAASAASAVAWPAWSDYTPRVYDALRGFFEGAGSLPDKVSPQIDGAALPYRAA